MNSIIAYIYFTNSKDFEKWQTKNKKEILSIVPQVFNAIANTKIHNEDNGGQENTEMQYNLGIFVTYRKLI